MAHLIELPTHTDPRGSLTVLEKILPFEIKRVFWIDNLSQYPRGQHRHHVTQQALFCMRGECEVLIKHQQEEKIFVLRQPHQGLILNPEDWHEMRNFINNPLLIVFASHYYDATDYIKEAV